MADMKYIIDTSDVVAAQRDIRQWAKVNRDSLNVVNQRMTSFGKTSELAFNQFGRAASKAQQRSKRFASVGLQQVGYQVQDFAVQVQGGTSALVALGQQGSQLLGIFGAGGAIAGMFLAIGTGLAGAFLAARDAAKSAAEAADTLSDAISSATQAVEIHQMSIVELTDKYGRLGLEAKKAALEIAKADYRTAVSDLKNYSIPVLNEMMEAMELYNSTELFSSESNKATEQLQEIRNELQLSAAEFNDLQDAYTRFQNAGNLQQSLDAAIDLRRVFSEIPEEVLSTNSELNGMVSALSKAFLQGGELEDLMRELNESAPGSGWMDQAIKGVNGLIARVLAGIRGVQTLKGEAGAKFGEGPALVLDPSTGRYVESGQEGRGNLATNMGLDLGTGTLGGGKGTSGGAGGGGAAVDTFGQAKEALDNLIASYDEAKERQMDIARAQETVNQAMDAGVISTEQGTQVLQDYIASLEEAKNPMADFANNAARQMADAFTSIVDGSKSASDAFKDMARVIIEQAFRMAVINPIINGIFGGVGGFNPLPSFFAKGGVFSNGKVTPFANGGVVSSPTLFPMANGAGLMGEAGPEAIMPLKRGKNGKLGVQVDGSAQQPVVINQSFNFSANGDESVKRIIAQEAPRIANLTQKQIMDQRRRGGAMKSTFG